MITAAEHIVQAEHNETFFQHVSNGTIAANDWRATLLFYAALHYIDAYLHQLNPPVGTHPITHRGCLRNTENYLGVALADDLRDLKDASEAARYDGALFTDVQIESLRTAEFARIRAHVRAALSLPE